jgi:hypothetical protein
MATQKAPGGHWSANNPIPTIQKFIENLDKEKKERDKSIDEENRQKRDSEKEAQKREKDEERRAAIPHKPEESRRHKPTRMVTDPTTGREVKIEDVGRDFVKEAKKSEVGISNSRRRDCL